MKKPYHIFDSSKQQPLSPDQLTRLLSQNAQLMPPLVELAGQCRGALTRSSASPAAPLSRPCSNSPRSKLPEENFPSPARSAAASLREGIEECFTIHRLGLPPSLHRSLAATNIVESPNAGVRRRTRRVTRWKDAAMVSRWAAAAFLDTEKSFRKIMGYKDLWMLDAILNPANTTGSKAA